MVLVVPVAHHAACHVVWRAALRHQYTYLVVLHVARHAVCLVAPHVVFRVVVPAANWDQKSICQTYLIKTAQL